MHNHIDSFSLCQYPEKDDEICIVLQIYFNSRERCQKKSDQKLWHSHRSRFAQLFHLLNCGDESRIQYNQPLNANRSLFFCVNSASSKNHLY